MSGQEPYRHRFPLSVISYALRLYHRFSLSQRDVQELFHERGVVVSHEDLAEVEHQICSAPDLGIASPRTPSGFSVTLNEMHVRVGGGHPRLWRAVDEYGDVLDVLLQEHRDTEAARSFFMRLLATY